MGPNDEHLEQLLDSGASLEARRSALAAVLGAPGPAERLEAALPDLLAGGDEPLLLELIHGLASLASHEGAARRVLELLSRRPGATRLPALRALRGTP